MKEIHQMRLGVLREIKNAHRFFDHMERSVKTRNPDSIQSAYVFMRTLVEMMNDGELSPDKVALNLELAKEMSGEIE